MAPSPAFLRPRIMGWMLAVTAVLPGATLSQEQAALLTRVDAALEAGRFSQAESMLKAGLANRADPLRETYAQKLEIIRRIRLDYSLNSELMFKKLDQAFWEITPEEMEQWRQRDMLQYRVIDGLVRYFKSEPSNLLRFNPELTSRLTDSPEDTPTSDSIEWTNYLSKLVRLAGRSADPQIDPIKHRVSYSLTVKSNHTRLRPGAVVRCWLPFPQEYRQQKQVHLLSSSSEQAVVSPNGQSHRTVYFEHVVQDPAKPVRFSTEVEFVTYAYCPRLDAAKARPYDRDSELFGGYTAQRLPHIALTPEVRELAGRIVAGEANPLLRAKKIFLWVCQNIRYCSEIEYSTIANLSAKGLTTRQGDCGVQGMVLITLSRAAGIPARWQSGWQTKPGHQNMHDWAEVYVEPWGWLPVDPSYGLQDSDDPAVREFFFGHLDAYRMIVNLGYAADLSPPKKSFRSEPNDFQRGELEIDGVNCYFDEWEWTFHVVSTPAQ